MVNRQPLAVLLGLGLFLAAGCAWAESRSQVDRVSVTVEKRQGRDWCVLDARVSAVVPASIDALWSVITSYDAYPLLFPDIREARAEAIPGATLLTEKVVVSALGIDNINRFTLRMVRSEGEGPRRVVRLDWTQERTDGTIDSLEGGWVLEDRGTPESPQVFVSYRSHSAVPMLVFGQDTLVRLFLGDRTKSVVETVAKKAISR